MSTPITDLALKAAEAIVTMAVASGLGWIAANTRVDKKIDEKLAALRSQLLGDHEAYKATHSNVHVTLDQALMKRFQEVEESINSLDTSVRDSAADYAKDAVVAQALMEVNAQCRALLKTVSTLEGTIDTMIRLRENR